MSGTVDNAAAQAAAREAARREAARIAAENARRLAQEQANQQASQQAAQQPPADAPLALTAEQFVADGSLAEALDASQAQMRTLFEQAASLDGDAETLSNAELEQLFLHVQAGQALESVAPAGPRPPGPAEQDAEPTKAQEVFEEILGGQNKTVERYLKAKKAFDALNGDPKACAECAAELLAAGAELMQALAAKGSDTPALRKQVATALDVVRLDAGDAQAAVSDLDLKGAGGELLGKAAEGLGKLIELTDAFKTLASGGEGDGLKHGLSCAEAGIEIAEGLGDLFGTAARSADGTVKYTPGLIQELAEQSGKLTQAGKEALAQLRARLAQTGFALAEKAGGGEAYQAAVEAAERIAAQAGKFGDRADAMLAKLEEKLLGAIGKWAEAGAERGALVAEKLALVLGKVATFLETAGGVLTAAQIALEVTDFMLRELYMPAKEALTGIFSSQRHMGNDPNKLLELYQGGAGAFGDQARKLATLRGQPGYEQLYAQVTQDAQQFVRQVNETLLCQNAWDKGAQSEMLRDEVGALLTGQRVSVVAPDGRVREADAGALYARARGKAAPPLSPAEAAALAGPLGKAATEVLAKDLAARDQLTPVGLAPENLTPAVLTAMAGSNDPLLLAQYVRSLSDAQLERVPRTVKRQLFEALAKQQAGVLDQALGGDALPQCAGRVLAAIMKDNAAGPPPLTPAQQVVDLQALLGQGGALNRDNVLRFAVAGLGREALDQLPTALKQAIATEVAQPPVSEQDAETATRVAASIRRVENQQQAGRGDALADALEGAFSWHADAVARTRVAELTDAELDQLPLAEKQGLAQAMLPTLGTVGELAGSLSADDVKQLTRLADAIRRNRHPADGLSKAQAGEAADALMASISRFSRDDAAVQRVEALEPAALARLTPADLNQLLADLTASGTRVDDAEKDAIAKVTLALVEQAGLDASGLPRPEPQRAADQQAAYEAARARLAGADPLLNLDSGSLQDDVAGRMLDQLKARGEALDPARDLLAALPAGMRRQLFEDLSQGWASADDLARAARLAATFTGEEQAAMLAALAGGLTNRSDVTAASLEGLSADQLASLVEADPEQGYALMCELQDNAVYTSDQKDALTARVALALMKGQPADARGAIIARTLALCGYASGDNVARAVIDGLGPFELAALPAATREAMTTAIRGDAFFLTGTPEDADALNRLSQAGTLAAKRPQGPRDPAAAAKLQAELAAWPEENLARVAATRPEELEVYLLDVAQAPDSADMQALLARLAAALRAGDPRAAATQAAVDARLKALGL